MEELSVCDDLITHWKNSEKFPGTNYIPSKGVIVNKEEKDSIEVQIDKFPFHNRKEETMCCN